jgi:Uma2 family endonuclease
MPVFTTTTGTQIAKIELARLASRLMLMTFIAAKWSIDDYHQMVDSGLLNNRSVELINGEIIEVAPEGVEHSFYCINTGDYLRSIFGDRVRVHEAHPITLPNDSEPEPDIAILKPPISRYRTHHPYPDDIFWLIEISHSTIAIDLRVKKDLYARSGIPEYLVMNLPARELVVFRDLAEDAYQSETHLTNGTISSIAFPEIQVDIQRLFD